MRRDARCALSSSGEGAQIGDDLAVVATIDDVEDHFDVLPVLDAVEEDVLDTQRGERGVIDLDGGLDGEVDAESVHEVLSGTGGVPCALYRGRRVVWDNHSAARRVYPLPHRNAKTPPR